MKQFLRLLLAAGVLAFAASMLAVSCGKTPDAGGGGTTANNNSGGGSGGNGDGGNNQPQAGPPAIALTNFETTTAKLVAGTIGNLDTIRIKVSEIPTTAADGNTAANIGDLWDAPAGSLKRIFDTTITGGNAGDATGGLIMVGPGNIGNITNFSDPSGGVSGVGTTTEGFTSGQADTVVQHVYRHSGWNFYGVFMSSSAPTVADADTSPFAFTPIFNTMLGGGYQPFIFCRTTVPAIDNRTSARSTDTLVGGQTASCYVGFKGSISTFRSTTPTAWMTMAASATFKKTFNIAIGGFRTDAKAIKDFMPGADDNAKILAFLDGLNGAEIEEIIKTNPSAYKKVAVTIVSNADF